MEKEKYLFHLFLKQSFNWIMFLYFHFIYHSLIDVNICVGNIFENVKFYNY